MASPVDTSVKHFYSAMVSAPVVSGTAGSLIATLDACLVTGFGLKTVDSAAISGGVCRLAFSSGKSAAAQESVILVSGATNNAINGEQKVTRVGTDFVEFATAEAAGPVTGSITFKMAPLGWEKVFTGTNKAVYRPTDPNGTRPYIRVDDTNAVYARVQMYESMSDVDTGGGITPSLTGGWYWHKSDNPKTTARFWLLIGDRRGFYFGQNPYDYSSSSAQNGYPLTTKYAGDLNSYKSGDAWRAVLTGVTGTSTNVNEGCLLCTASQGFAGMRQSHGLGGTTGITRLIFGSTNAISGNDGMLGSFPSRADNGLRLSPILLTDGTSGYGPRGEAPGVYYCPQSGVYAGIGDSIVLTKGQGAFIGKTLLSVAVGTPGGNTNQGIGFWDITGPWR